MASRDGNTRSGGLTGLQLPLLGGGRPAVLASACLCGQRCRWHGKPTSKHPRVRALERSGETVVPICPEMLGGLPCPRPPVTRRRGRLYQTDAETRTLRGRDVTAAFERGAAEAVRIARETGATEAYLCMRSPSCDPDGGVTARALAAAGLKLYGLF
jgi:uncharacterized protein YbbK (DUF523 family)